MRPLGDLAATDFAAAGSREGKAWMAALPSLLRGLARQWNLIITGDLLGRGYNAVVVPVRQGGRPLALKLTWPPERAGKEADALAAWRARGAVELAACDAPRGALLLERLDASRSLASIPVAEAAAAAGALIRTLAIGASGSFPSLRAKPASSPPQSRHVSGRSRTRCPARGSRWRPGSPGTPSACLSTPTCTTATSWPASASGSNGWRSTPTRQWEPLNARRRNCSGPGQGSSVGLRRLIIKRIGWEAHAIPGL
jgi:hypothetical protein